MADRPRNLCVDPPNFTLKTLRDAIPAHCFKRSLSTSLMHVASDLAIVASFFYLATWIDSDNVLPIWSKFVLWPVYWGAQGSVLTGRATMPCRVRLFLLCRSAVMEVMGRSFCV